MLNFLFQRDRAPAVGSPDVELVSLVKNCFRCVAAQSESLTLCQAVIGEFGAITSCHILRCDQPYPNWVSPFVFLLHPSSETTKSMGAAKNSTPYSTFHMIIKYYSINLFLRRDRTLIVNLPPSYLPVEQVPANSITFIPPLITPQS